MKKILALLLALVLVFALAACNGGAAPKPTSDGTTDGGSQAPQSSQAAPSKIVGSPTPESVFAAGGLNLATASPDEPCYRTAMEDDDTVIFFMENGTERSAGAYIYKLLDACKAASDDGKVYEADFAYFMGTGGTEVELEPIEKIDGYWIYIFQCAYRYKGAQITITAGPSFSEDELRADDKTYNVYTVSVSVSN